MKPYLFDGTNPAAILRFLRVFKGQCENHKFSEGDAFLALPYFLTQAMRLTRPANSGTQALVVSVLSKGGYSDTVSGRTTCATCKADWPSVALMLTSVCTVVVGYSAVVRACQRVDIELHAYGQLQYGLANQGLIFSLVLLYYFTLGSYVYNRAQWQRRTPPA